MKCIEDEIPFDVPDGWEWCRISSVALVVTDGEHKTPKRCNEYQGYYLLSARNIQNGYLSLDDVDYVDEEEYIRISKRCNPRKNDVLLSCSGSLGRVTVVTDEKKYTMVRSAAMIRFLELDPFFEMQTLQSTELQTQIQNSSKQTAQANLFQGAILSLLIPVPPLCEQTKISNIVSSIIKKVENINNEKNDLANTIQLTKSKILNLAIQGKLVPQNLDDEPASVLLKRIRTEKDELIKAGKIKRDKKESVIFRGDDNSYYEKFADGNIDCIDEEIQYKLPDGWEYSRIKSIVKKDIKRGKAPKYTKNSNTMVFAQKCNRKKGEIDMTLAQYLDENALSKYPAEEFMQDGDILINSTGTGTLGRVGIYHSSDNIERKNIVPDSHVTTIRTYKEIQATYVYIFLKSIQQYLENHGEGSTNQKELKPDTLKSLIIPIPPCSEQQKIISIVKKAIDSLEEIETVLM